MHSVDAIDKAQLSEGECHWQSAEMERREEKKKLTLKIRLRHRKKPKQTF